MDSPKIGAVTAAAWKRAHLADHVIGVAKIRARASHRMERETRSQYHEPLIEATRELLKAFESAVNVEGRELDRFRAVSETARMAGIKEPSWHDLALRFASKVHFRVLPWGYETGMDMDRVLLDAETLGEAVEDMERLDLEELLANLLREDAKATPVIAKSRSDSKNIASPSRTPLKRKKRKPGGQKRYDAKQDVRIAEAWESTELKMPEFVRERELFRKRIIDGKKVPIWPDSEDMNASEREERAIKNLKAALASAKRKRNPQKKSKSP